MVRASLGEKNGVTSVILLPRKTVISLAAIILCLFCFGITYDCVKRVQASNNTLLDKPVNGVACPSNVESEAPNMRIDIQKRNMQHPSFSESELELNSPRRIVLCCSVIRS